MRDEVELLEHEADRVAAQPRPGRVVERADVWPADPDDVPHVGRSRQPSRPSIVDLPEPDGPTIDMKSPAKICERHIAQRVDLDLFAVRASDTLELEERGHASAVIRSGLGLVDFDDHGLVALQTLG